MRLLRTGLLVALVLALIAVPYTRRHLFSAGALAGFAAFSCGGEVLRRGHDPYRAEPLRTCERTLPSYGYDAANVVEPAPFPPFVLAAFGGLSLLPFAWAVGIYAALALAAIVLAAWALQRMTGFSPWFVGAALAVAPFYQNLRFGQLPPLVIGVLCGAALLLERGRAVPAALLAVVALIEPHVAAPVLLALFVASKASRVPLALAAIALAAISLVALDPSLTIEYFTRVLPAHAAAEITANDQFSVTWFAHALGAGDAWALRAGSISYALAALLGIVTAVRLARRFARPAFVVLVPAAFAVIGGTFVHDIQLTVAMPAALLLAAVTTGGMRALAVTAAQILAVTWYDDVSAALSMAALATMAWNAPFVFAHISHRVVFVLNVCGGYGAAIIASHTLPQFGHAALPPHPDAGGPPQELASESWARFVRTTAYGAASLKTIAQKLPLVAALALLAGTALHAARAQRALGDEPSAPLPPG